MAVGVEGKMYVSDSGLVLTSDQREWIQENYDLTDAELIQIYNSVDNFKDLLNKLDDVVARPAPVPPSAGERLAPVVSRPPEAGRQLAPAVPETETASPTALLSPEAGRQLAPVVARTEEEMIDDAMFGVYAHFFRKNKDSLIIGLDENGMPVSYEEGVTTVSIVDYIEDNEIESTNRQEALLRNTEWWQNTNQSMRTFDTDWAGMNQLEKEEYLEGTIDQLRQININYNLQLSNEKLFKLAADIKRFGDENNPADILEYLYSELQLDFAEADSGQMKSDVDTVKNLASKYFIKLSDEKAAEYAREIFIGNQTVENLNNLFGQQASATYPELASYISNGFTPDDYFDSHKAELASMLEINTQSIDLMRDFPEIIQFIPDNESSARPMTIGELRKHIRGMPEWQQTTGGKSAAILLAENIASTFGKAV